MATDPSRWEVVDDAMAEILRRKTEAERLAIAFGMWDFAQQMIRANLRREHPEGPDENVGALVGRQGPEKAEPERRGRTAFGAGACDVGCVYAVGGDLDPPFPYAVGDE